MTLNYVIWWFIKPSHLLPFSLALGGVLVLAGRKRAGRVVLGSAVVGLVLCGALPLGAWLIAPLEDRFPETRLPAEVDGIIVLAGAELPALTARRRFPHLNEFSDRLVAGLLLAEDYPEALVVHSGRLPVHRSEEFGEETSASDVAAAVFIGAGLDESRLVLENRSSDTCESPDEVARLMAPQSGEVWLLVTSAYHMPRSVACFRAAGFEVIAVPVDYQRLNGSLNPLSMSLTSNLERLDLAVHEWLGLAYYRVRGRTDELFPAP